MSQIPTILLNFERILLTLDFCSDFLVNEYKVEFSFVKFSVMEKLLHVTTSAAVLYDYNFESLETLGDSIIKFVLTLILLYNRSERGEGIIQSIRREMLKIDKLQELGIES